MGNFPKSWNVQKINILIAVGWITEEFFLLLYVWVHSSPTKDVLVYNKHFWLPSYCSAVWFKHRQDQRWVNLQLWRQPCFDLTETRNRISTGRKIDLTVFSFLAYSVWADNSNARLALCMQSTHAKSLRNEESKLPHLSFIKTSSCLLITIPLMCKTIQNLE